MKIKLTLAGEAEFAVSGDDAAAIRAALDGIAPGDPAPAGLYDVTDMERSNVDPDEHLAVIDHDGTVLWSGWLGGVQRPAPQRAYPHDYGDAIALGPQVFASKDRSVICWRGENYQLAAAIPQPAAPAARSPLGAQHAYTAACDGFHAPGPCPEPAVRYALIEQMGHRSTIGAVTETTFAGRPMLAVTALPTGREHLISPDSLYEVTWLEEAEARRRAAPYVPPALPPALAAPDARRAALAAAPADDGEPGSWAGAGYDGELGDDL